MTALTLNPSLNGIEISFDRKPSAETLKSLKGAGFRWHAKKKIWYAKQTAERLSLAHELAGEPAEAAVTRKAEIKAVKYNHSLRVGDILEASWGYEQTNVDFFLVVKASTSCVWVKECTLPLIKDEAVSGMARNARYDISNPVIKEDGYFVDQVNGSRFKVHNYSKNSLPENDSIKIKDSIIAHKYSGETVYESWYY